MVNIIIASHGKMAEGIFQSGSMIFGDQENVKVCSLLPSEGPADFRKKVEEAIASFEDQENILFLVDLFGGTPYNQINGLLDGKDDKWAMVCGMNLGMLVEAYGMRFDPSKNAHDIATHIIGTSREGIKGKPESVEPAKEVKAAGPAHQSAIPEGTVLGDGHIKFVLARVDTRLLHGQVATAWTKATQPDRIIVVSDNVAKDALRKSMIIEAAPPGVRCNVVPIDKMIKVVNDTRFGDTKALLLFETPQDALKAIKGGVDIKTLNIGSMAHSLGKVAVNKAIAIGKEDFATFDELKELGVEFDVRKVPADSKENMQELLNKAKAELK